MKRRYKILGWVALVLLVGLVGLEGVLGHNSPCSAPAALTTGGPLMKAVVQRCYGPSSALTVERMPKPAPADDELLVRVQAASLNPLDWHYARGTPTILRLDAGIGRPKDWRTGADFAGTVEAVGRGVHGFHPGDAVFGVHNGAFGQYLTVAESRSVVLKPGAVSFEQAAALPIAGITALQALRDMAHLQPGQSLLVNGASGGVGTFAVQLGRMLGAHVTGVCSTRNVALVGSLGAERVIDYAREDFAQGAARYDVILDTVGNRSLRDLHRTLKPGGILIGIGGGTAQESGMLGPLLDSLRGKLVFAFSHERFALLFAHTTKPDLDYLASLVGSGQLNPVIGQRFTLDETPAALTLLEGGHARGKFVVQVD